MKKLKKTRNTNIEMKREYFPKFVKLVEEQLSQGANKYANSNEREYTDLICDVVGTKQFIIGNILKYSGRIINDDPRQATDIVKIATYAFLLWVKIYAED